MNPKLISNSNYVLNKIFNNDENLDIVQDFIEKIVGINISKIKNISSKHDYKVGIINVEVETKDSEKINIGIQYIDGGYIQEKILIYAATMHVNYDGNNEKHIITINIMNNNFFSAKEYHKKIVFKEKGMIFHVIELPKFKKIKLETEEELWMAYLKADNKDIVKEAKEKNNKIQKLDEKLDIYWKEEKI